jgi:hypothetical protein
MNYYTNKGRFGQVLAGTKDYNCHAQMSPRSVTTRAIGYLLRSEDLLNWKISDICEREAESPISQVSLLIHVGAGHDAGGSGASIRIE